MKRATALLAFALVFTISGVAAGAARVGQAAPDFTAIDSNGQTHNLSEYKGKFVVLEWHNNGCPFVRKHYESGNMQKLPKGVDL